MKLSELIRKLEELKDKHGDVDVVMADPHFAEHYFDDGRGAVWLY